MPSIRHRCSPAFSVQTTRLQLAVGVQEQIAVPYIRYTGHLDCETAYETAALHLKSLTRVLKSFTGLSGQHLKSARLVDRSVW